MDVSVAVTHVRLPVGFRRAVKFPRSVINDQGGDVHLDLKKAMNGLRKEPAFLVYGVEGCSDKSGWVSKLRLNPPSSGRWRMAS